jgi:hypothetical protein
MGLQKGFFMNQPTKEQFEGLKKRVEKLEQQQTEPIKVTIERRQTETELILDNHTAMLQELSSEQDSQSTLLQTIFNIVGTRNTDIAILQHEMQGARADIIAIKATQSDHSELLKYHGQMLKEHGEWLKDHGQRLGRIEAIIATMATTMATKQDIASIKATQDQILHLLQKSGE